MCDSILGYYWINWVCFNLHFRFAGLFEKTNEPYEISNRFEQMI